MSQVKVLTSENSMSLIHDFFIVIFSTLLIGLFGGISIPLPFTPVPIATQPQLILLLAALLGPKRAALSVVLFLFQASIGLPVLAGALGGSILLTGPTGGYLLGYVFAALLTGSLVEKMKQKKSLQIFLAMSAGNAVIFLMGSFYLASFIGFPKALLLGVAPFLLGDLVKLVFCSKIFERTRKILTR